MSSMKMVYIALDIIFLANVNAAYDKQDRMVWSDDHSPNSFQGLSSSGSGANAAAASLFSDNDESIDPFQRQDSFFFPSQDSFFDEPQDSFYSLKTEKEEEEEEEEEQQQEQQTSSYFTSQYDDPIATEPDYAEQHVLTPLWRQNTMQFNDGDDHGIGIATGVMSYASHEITFLPPIIRIFEQIFLPNNKLLITSDATPQMFYQPRQDTAKLICNYINKKISTIERYQHDPSDMKPFGACFTYRNSKHGKHDISIDMKQLGLRGKILFQYLTPNVEQQEEIEDYELLNYEFGTANDIYFPHLIYLDLSHNYIIQTLNLQYLKHCAIETLVLSHNGIYGDIDFTGVHKSSLQSISLSYNDIKNVNWDSLSYSIYHDKIYSATGQSIPWFTAVHWTNLKYIYLAGNPRLDTKINVITLKDSEFHLIDLQYVDNVKIIGIKDTSDKLKDVNTVNGKRTYVVANKPNGQIIY